MYYNKYISCISTYIPLLTLIYVMQVVYGFYGGFPKGQRTSQTTQSADIGNNPELVCEEINNLFLGFNRITLSFSFI